MHVLRLQSQALPGLRLPVPNDKVFNYMTTSRFFHPALQANQGCVGKEANVYRAPSSLVAAVGR